MADGDPVHVEDESGMADVNLAKATWRHVVGRYGRLGLTIGRPVRIVIEAMPIMGATEPTSDGFRLHVAAHAVRSGMLDGLMAHEAGHMIRMEQGHPSHLNDVHRRALESVSVPTKARNAFLGVARAAINHVEDIYADDLSIRVIGRDRDMAAFFSDWVRNSAEPGGTRWETIGRGVTAAFALGNLARHGIKPEDGVALQAKRFAGAAILGGFPGLVAAFRDLPKTEDADPIEAAIRDLLAAIASQAG